MPRREFSAATKRAAWERCGGHCEGVVQFDGWMAQPMPCGAPLNHGCFHYDHCDPDWYSKDNELSNCKVLCRLCHAAKTKVDVKAIAKSKRIRDKRIKARKPKGRPLPGTRASGLRKRMDGTVERW